MFALKKWFGGPSRVSWHQKGRSGSPEVRSESSHLDSVADNDAVNSGYTGGHFWS